MLRPFGRLLLQRCPFCLFLAEMFHAHDRMPEFAGARHSVSVSQPKEVTALIEEVAAQVP